VCYEIFVRSFSDSNGDGIGDFPGLTAKLDYVKGLGVNCIWLMPITQSPSYHGYDTTDFYTINKDYGTNDDFKKFRQEARSRGIAVLMDLVVNHTSNRHPWFIESQNPNSPKRTWYIWNKTEPEYRGPWGDQAWWELNGEYYYGMFSKEMPDLNYRNPEVTKEMYNITRFWLSEMGVDGFRVDAVKHLVENQRVQLNTPETWAWLREWRKFYKGINPNAWTVGEINQNGASFEMQGYYPDQLDSYFEFGIATKILRSVNRGSATYILEGVNYANQNWPFQQWSSFLTNHDQERVMGLLLGNVEKMKLASAALFTVPGVPFVYYGEEIGQEGAKPDPRIRTPMQWDDSATVGFTSGSKTWIEPDKSAAKANVKTQENDPNSLLNHYRKLIKLRRESSALSGGSWIPLSADNDAVAAYMRQSENEVMLVLLNLDKTALDNVTVSLEKSRLKPGQYKGQELLQGATAGTLTVANGGIISNGVPLAKLEGNRAYIIKLTLG
jgi:glycosidase